MLFTKQNSPINIYINGRFLTQKLTQGVQRYAFELLKALDELIQHGEISVSQYKFTLLSPKNTQHSANFKHIAHQKCGFFRSHFWEHFELPFFARDGFLINLTGSAPIAKFNQLTTVHDVSVFATPEAYSFIFKTYYKLLLNILKYTSKNFITVSNFSKKEIIKYLGINAENIQVLYEGKEHIFSFEKDDSFLEKKSLNGKKFLFVVSSTSPHKNFSSVIKALEELTDIDLFVVIVGIDYPKVFMPPKLQASDKVMHLGYVSNSELRTLYENAFCFIHPSLYEGFGLPPLEAMACGCPVIVSEIASLPEICGEAVLYFNPKKPKDIADKIRLLFENSLLREDLIQKSKKHAEIFSWKKTAKDFYNIINKVI